MMRVLKTLNFLTPLVTRPLFINCNRQTSYKSDISLEKLYPKSSLKLITPTKPFQQTPDFDGFIPLDQLDITYSRSSGPGGQNVNKVETKVDVRFHLESAIWLSDKVRSKVLERFGSKLTKDGFLVFRSDITRSQQMNLADCLEKLRKCIRDSIFEKPAPSEESLERARKRMERANRERIAQKRMHGMMKRDRQVLNVNL